MKNTGQAFAALLALSIAGAACSEERSTPPPATLPSAAAAVPAPGRIAAVDLLGAWVDAGASQTGPFEFTGLDGRIYAADFDTDIRPLFERPNLWFNGAKRCSNCHTADLAEADAELDLTSYEGIIAGSYRLSNPPGIPIIAPGNWQASPLRDRLMWNRMPPGIGDKVARDGPEVKTGGGKVLAVNLIGAWVDAGAPGPRAPFQFVGLDGATYTTTYGESVEPLFSRPLVWSLLSLKSCRDCHRADLERADAELDLTTVEAILAGSYRLAQPPGVPTIIPGDWDGSLLRERLRNNRMPTGIPPEAPPEGPVVEAGRPK